MFNLGFPELLVLGIIALVVLGPDKLPEAARTFMRFLNEMRRASSEVTDALTQVRDDTHKAFNEMQNKVQESIDAAERIESSHHEDVAHHDHDHDHHHGHGLESEQADESAVEEESNSGEAATKRDS